MQKKHFGSNPSEVVVYILAWKRGYVAYHEAMSLGKREDLPPI